MATRILLIISIVFSLSLHAQNNSLLFDGLDDMVVMEDDPIYNLTDGFTVEAWIYANAWKPNSWQGTIIGKDLDPQRGFVLRAGANGTLSWTIGTGSDWNEITSGPVMSTDTWYHVAAVLDDGESRIYINGSLAGTGTCPASVVADTELLIGESSGFSGRVFDGRIDEVRIWNLVRSQEEIAANQAEDLPASTPGLVAYYKLDETSGTTASNLIDPGTTDGTLVNFGNSPWQSGYTIPGLDLKTDAIISPDALTLADGVGQVKARFVNNGLEAITEFQVSYSFNGNAPIVESITQNVASGETYTHTFAQAVFSNGGTDNLTVTAMLSDDSNTLNDVLEYSYTPLDGPNTIMIFDAQHHNFAGAGQSHVSHVPLPENNSDFGRILMNIWLDCPNSGCDPWDQPAKISLVKDGVTYELARFITPYGIACGPWVVDVTSFKSILQGDCDFQSYIQVWGASGWMLNASLTYLPEAVDFPFQRVSPVYDTDNWVYGDPGIEDDLPAVTLPIHPLTEDAQYHLTVTGHGQANTDNAAEFSPKTHSVMVDGSVQESHFLWKDDCESNDCSGQFGTWLFDRAGWCPGQGVDPLLVELGSDIDPGTDIELDYELQDYTNLLNTGYNGSTHTEPHYKIHAYLVEKSSMFIDDESWTNGTALTLESPAFLSDLSVSTPLIVSFSNTGTIPLEVINLKAYVNQDLMLDEDLTLTEALMPGSSTSYTFSSTLDLSDDTEDIQLTILIAPAADEAANDNSVHAYFDIVSGLEENSLIDLKILPNPSSGEVVLFAAGIKDQSVMVLRDIAGREVMREIFPANALNQGHRTSLPFPAGTYLMELISSEGQALKRLVIE